MQENLSSVHTEMQEKIIIEKMSNVKAERIDWLWNGIIAYGKITLFAGDPGGGKSQLLLYIASIVSNGGKFHFSLFPAKKHSVLLISGEDNAEDTIKPRLMALGADHSKIDYVKGIKKVDKKGNSYFDAICLMEHLAELEDTIRENQYKLIIVDPVSLYLRSVDSNNNTETRTALAMLTALAERHKVAIVINSHFSKRGNSGNKNAIERVMGSIAWAAASRMVYGIIKDPDNPDRRFFIPIKNNIAKDNEGYVYTIESCRITNGIGDIETSKVNWLPEKIDQTANELLNTVREIKSPELENAKQFLYEKLKFGSELVTNLREESQLIGISTNRLYAAKKELKIYESTDIGSGKRKRWSLSPDSPAMGGTKGQRETY
jgi:putative DNA primase/helicase